MDQTTAHEGWNALAFFSEDSHDLDNLSSIERTLRMGAVETERAFAFGEQLVANVHPSAQGYIDALRARLGDAANHGYLRTLEYAYRNMRFHYLFEKLSDNERHQFYAPDGPVLVPYADSKKLIVVLPSMFNSFVFSNAAMARMLYKLECNVLFLKDSTLACHLLGVRNFAHGLDEVGPSIERVAEEHGLEEIYLAGFSSSGYAALSLSTEMQCHGCIVFSASTGNHKMATPENSEAREFQDRFHELVDLSLAPDLLPLLEKADSSIPRTLYYGELDLEGRKQAMRLAGMEGIDLVEVRDIGRQTPLKLMADRQLLPAFAKLVGFKPRRKEAAGETTQES